MRGTSDVGGIYPLSTEPAEGYGVDPTTRSGEVVITHVNRNFVKIIDDGMTFVSERGDATRFPDHSTASLAAAKLIKAAQQERQAA